MGKYFSHLKWEDRLKIETLQRNGFSQTEMARQIGCSQATISRELKRGRYNRLRSDLTEYETYSPDQAQDKYMEHLSEKGPGLKIGKDIKYAKFLEEKVLEGYSPEAALSLAERENRFKTRICRVTFYNYIDKGLFQHLTNKDLPVKKNNAKRKFRPVRRARSAPGDSIEKRPAEIRTREDFGHWEMDTVRGKQGKSKSMLLVLTERKTRDEIIMLLRELTAEAVVKAMDSLEHKWGKQFSQIFKTITVDNGVEFSYREELEKSKLSDGYRTKLYYCHPYSSYERGSNENQNKMIRRMIPKGTDLDLLTEEEVAQVEHWLNHYPRRMFSGDSAAERFERELSMAV